MIRGIVFSFGIVFFSTLVPDIAHAAVRITEIMYDVPGANANRQWIEVTNRGDSPVDLGAKTVRVLDKSGNHLIKVVQGSALLAPEGVAVIAQNADGFMADNPSYQGTLLKSSFALTAASTIAVTNADSVTYTSALGGKGDGNSLQFSTKSNSFIAGAPTPGLFPEVPPAAIVAPAKPSSGSSGSNRQATGTHSKSPTKHTKTNSSQTTYDTGSVAPTGTADAAPVGAPFTLPAFILPYLFILSSVWFAGFIGLVTFSGFSLFVLQQQYSYE